MLKKILQKISNYTYKTRYPIKNIDSKYDEIINELNERGVVKIKSFFTKELANKIINDFYYYINNLNPNNIIRTDSGLASRLYN